MALSKFSISTEKSFKERFEKDSIMDLELLYVQMESNLDVNLSLMLKKDMEF